MAYMIRAACFFGKFQVSGYLSVLAFRADTSVSVFSGILTVMDVSASEQAVVLAMGHDEFSRSLASNMACLIMSSDWTPWPSSEKAMTLPDMAAMSARVSPFSPAVMAP